MVSATSTTTRKGDVNFATPRARSSFNDVLKEARNAFNRSTDKTFQGPLLADPQPAQKRARRDLLDIAEQGQDDFGRTFDLASDNISRGQDTIDLAASLQGSGQNAVRMADRLQGIGQGSIDQAQKFRGLGENPIEDARQLSGTGKRIVNLGENLQGSGQGVIDLGQRTAAGEFLDVRNRPEFQANIDASLAPIREQLLEDILPQAQSQAVQSGAFGGSRAKLTREQALEDFSKQASRTTAQIAAQAYENERARQQRAGNVVQQGVNTERSISDLIQRGVATESQINQMLQQGVDIERSISDLARRGVIMEQDVAKLRQQGVDTEARISDLMRSGAATMNDFQNIMGNAQQLQTFGPRLAESVGARQRADQQAQFDADQRRFQMEQQAPWIGLPQYAGIVSGAPTSQSTTQQSTPSESQQVGNYIQGGLGLASGINQLTDTGSGGIVTQGLSAAGDFIGGLF